MRVRFAAVVVVSVVAVVATGGSATSQTQPTANVFSYVPSGWVDYSANSKPYETYYADGLKAACAQVDQLDLITKAASDVGLNATTGDRTGRLVARVRTQDLGAKAAKAVAMLKQPSCLAYAADAVVSGALAQYPTRPAAPTYGATVGDVGGVARLDFAGTSTSGPFGGAILLASAGNIVNFVAVRVANPQAGELDAVVSSLAPTVRYGAEVASVKGLSPKLFSTLSTFGPAGDTAFVNALKTSFPDAAATAAPRTTAPAYPAGCDDATDGFVYSGQKSALGGTAVGGGGGQVQVRVTPQVFANTKDAKTYAQYFDDATACLQSVYAASAGGQPVQPVTRAPAKGLSTKAGECSVAYSTNIGSPTAATRAFVVYLVPGKPLGVTASAQFAGTPAAQSAATSLCSMLSDAYGKA